MKKDFKEIERKTLPRNLRGQLERKIQEARDIAEAAAHIALNQLGVGEANPFSYMSFEERSLRNRLRAHGRQLGDVRDNSKHTQEIDLLTEEIAYQHWHRMLFARFLAENDLLMYPDPVQPVAVTLDECQELAEDLGARNGWELAANFAATMLPQIFGIDSPVFELELPPEHQQKLEEILNELPTDIFTASDSLGWVYQFWQTKRKAAINNSNLKIGARELPAVTQLFTEDYMVSFLLDNTLGAWWAGQCLSTEQLRDANSEEELQKILLLPGMPLNYLRFIRDEQGLWPPAAGTFKEWPGKLSEFKLLDPCCGSGHFLVAAFSMLVPMRIQMDGLTPQAAVDSVLRENLYGLEIDQRCVELAAFALALTAWRYPGAGGYRQLPELNLACSGLALSGSREEWRKLAGNNSNLRIALNWIYEIFRDAPHLGSLLDPRQMIDGTFIDWGELAANLEILLTREEEAQKHEMGVVAHGLARSARILSYRYNLIATNVPYLARSKQGEVLRNYCEKYYNDAKNDIATVFLERCLNLCTSHGTVSVVLPQNWLFLSRYRKLRETILKRDTWHFVVRLGSGAFETISGEVVKVVLLIIDYGQSSKVDHGNLGTEMSSHIISGLDVSSLITPFEKADRLKVGDIQRIDQIGQLENHDMRIVFKEIDNQHFLHSHAVSVQGLATSDDPQFTLVFWELSQIRAGWVPLRGTVKNTTLYGGCERILHWDHGTGRYFRHAMALKKEGRLGGWKSGNEVRGKKGVIISQMNQIPVSLYLGEFYDHNACVILPTDESELPAIWTYCSSSEFYNEVRAIDQSLKPSNNTFIKVPFDLQHWQQAADRKYPNGIPKPYSDDPTQWIFHGHPARSEQTLQVAVARLLGYRWPAELDAAMELSSDARALVEKSQHLLAYSDKDGIVCIPAVGGEAPGTERLLNLLAAAYGENWSKNRLSELLADVNHNGKSLETWLRDKFFSQHCQLFQHRPFIWNIWDGLRDGFSALVNYHKLDRKNLENLIYRYLGDWIRRQNDDMHAGVDGAGDRLLAAENLKKKLELILIGEAPYDIFVRWKPLETQSVGWEPDLTDGVRLNIRPFMSVSDVGKKGAGCLRDKPNIKWDKDRGKDVDTAPWFHLFNGDRINNHHLTLAEKKAARLSTTTNA